MAAPTLKNCPVCHKLFLDKGYGVCNNCMQEQSETKQKILQYVQEHPGCTVAEIASALNASMKLIKYLREHGDLVDLGAAIKYPCKKCGALIDRGTYCRACTSEFAEANQKIQQRVQSAERLSDLSKELKKDNSPKKKVKLRMHFINMNDDT